MVLLTTVPQMIVAVLQARVSSSRMPGKVLAPILGMPMLARQIERVRRCSRIDRLVVATSTRADDDPILDLCAAASTPVYRGSLDDVLDRVYRAAQRLGPSHVVRLTGDCPLADWVVIDRTIDLCVEGCFDYASNTLRPTFPDGLDVEVMRFAALARAWHEAELPSEREHVTPFIHRRPEMFRLGSLEQQPDRSALRWTVDEPEDYRFVNDVYEALYPADPAFTTQDIFALLEARGDLSELNRHIGRNEGMRASLAADLAFQAPGDDHARGL